MKYFYHYNNEGLAKCILFCRSRTGTEGRDAN